MNVPRFAHGLLLASLATWFEIPKMGPMTCVFGDRQLLYLGTAPKLKLVMDPCLIVGPRKPMFPARWSCNDLPLVEYLSGIAS